MQQSLTNVNQIGANSRATAAHHPELVAVHLLPEDVDPSQTAVDAVDGALQVHLPKQRNKRRK
jgi:HSP20 family molecular chaperone IbpA